MNTMSHWKEIAFLVYCRELCKRKVASMALKLENATHKTQRYKGYFT